MKVGDSEIYKALNRKSQQDLMADFDPRDEKGRVKKENEVLSWKSRQSVMEVVVLNGEGLEGRY